MAASGYGGRRSYIEGNNEIGPAFVVVIPVLYPTFQTQRAWLKYAVLGCCCCGCCHVWHPVSRCFSGDCQAMSGFLWLKPIASWRWHPVVGCWLTILAFMPESWHSRMDTIKTYQTMRQSAMGRINAGG